MLGVHAVVQENDRTRPRLFHGTIHDGLDGERIPVARRVVPGHGDQRVPREHAHEPRRTQPLGRTEEAWDLAGGGANGFLRRAHIGLELGGGLQRERDLVVLGVVPDHVAVPHDACSRLRVAAHVVAHEEERGAHMFALQDVEHSGRVGLVRPVVEGKRHQLSVRAAAPVGLSEQAGARSESAHSEADEHEERTGARKSDP